MNLLPADIILIKRGTLWMPFAPLIWAWQRVSDPTLPWSWAYHVEMPWDEWPTEDRYRAFSLQPPVLDIVERKFADLKFSVYRLKNRPENMDELFWQWGNHRIHKQPYVLGWSTCGHPVAEFYKEHFGIEMSPYPGPIENVCKHSGKFVRITIN